MKKYIFKHVERFTIWSHHDCKCFWCGEPIRLFDTTIDHVLPEHLLEKPTLLNKVKVDYNLPIDFKINDFCNWVPSHQNCNGRKGKTILKNSPVMMFTLNELFKKSKQIRRVYERLLKDKESDKIIGKILIDLNRKKISDKDLISLLKSTSNIRLMEVPDIDKDKLKNLYGDWEVLYEDKLKKSIFVTNGRSRGEIPIEENPDLLWMCTTCKRYGPWSGLLCLNCGNKGELWD